MFPSVIPCVRIEYICGIIFLLPTHAGTLAMFQVVSLANLSPVKGRLLNMNNNTTKAVVATVDLGFAKIEGLMLPDSSYAIAVPQLAEVFSFDKNQASRTVKSLLGKNFQFDTAKTELNPKSVNILSLAQATKVIYLLARKGNEIANEFMLALTEEGLDRRFSKAFNQRVTEEEYQSRIALRLKRLEARRLWTDVLRDRSLDLWNEKPTPEQYRLWTVLVNERLFNKRHFQCNRDNMDLMEQETVELFERMAERKSKLHPNATPDELIEMALASFE